ncbi:uncharacterized protein PAE49_000798 isoform 2-T2 [Odontesthes bonariensis]|uniref:uncharacterized protein LOC142373853 isoform X2 n=1 Tax=Odontesthes bonariensis TaxID=219752 RepID=UPI003F588481
MSSEVCPFCGKTYKRLKSHLPHCKAAASSKAPTIKQNDTPSQTSSSHLAAVLPKTTAKGKKSTQMSSVTTDLQAERVKNVSVSSPEALQSSVSSSLLPSSTKKKKQKLADQIKTAIISSAPSPPPSPNISKPKKKSVRTLIEAARSDKDTTGSQEGTVSTLKDSSPSFKNTEQTETRTNADKLSVKVDSHGLMSADTKPKKKASKTKEAPSTTTHTSDFQHSNAIKSSTRAHAKDNFWVDNEEETEDVSVDKFFLKLGSGHQGKVTLQDVKATLGRKSSRPSILSRIEAADNLSSKMGLDADLSPVPLPAENQKDVISRLVTPVLPDGLISTSLKHTELQSVQRKSRQLAAIPLRDDAASQLEPSCPAAPLLSANASSQVQQAPPTPRTVNLNKGPKVGDHMTGLLSISPPLSQFSSPLLSPPAAQTLPGRVEALQLGVRKQNAADKPPEGALTQRGVGQVRLRELPEWLACRTPSHPREVAELVQRGWQWYYRRYIDVKKGGVGGLGMLLAGYCVLSYIWSYPHIKLSRWRKYH